MNKFVYTVFTQFLLIYLQLEIGNWGWALPLALMGSLYLTLAYGAGWGCGSALFNGMVLAVLYGGGWNNLLIIVHPLAASLLNGSSWATMAMASR